MEGVSAVNCANVQKTDKAKSDINYTKSALIGAGAGLAFDTLDLAYTAKKYADAQKENGINMKYTDSLKQTWKQFKEFGNVSVKDGMLESKSVLGVTGKKVMIGALALSAGIGAIGNIAIDKILNSLKS